MKDKPSHINGITHLQLFQQLASHWQLKRSIHSTYPTLPSGTFLGQALFTPQAPTAPAYQQEYRYQESGHFMSAHKTTLYSQQTYIYRLHTQRDQISVWQTDENKQALSEALHHWDTILPQSNTTSLHHHYIIQGTSHRCKCDHYQVDYRFHFSRTRLEDWHATYSVKGPKKNYRIENHYQRADNWMV